MKKINLIIFLVFIQSTAFAQVMGVNTEEPTRAVDVNGNLRITSIQKKSNDVSVTHLIVADDDGNVDITKKPTAPTADLSVETKSRVVILSNSDNPNIPELTVGGFSFGFVQEIYEPRIWEANFNGPETLYVYDSSKSQTEVKNNWIKDSRGNIRYVTYEKIKARVEKGSFKTYLAPAFRRVAGTSSFTYSVKMLDRRNNNTTGNNDGQYFFRNFTKSVGVTLVPILNVFDERSNNIFRREQYRLHLVHPQEEGVFYKVTFTRIQNSGAPFNNSQWNTSNNNSQKDIWVILVERFNNQHN